MTHDSTHWRFAVPLATIVALALLTVTVGPVSGSHIASDQLTIDETVVEREGTTTVSEDEGRPANGVLGDDIPTRSAASSMSDGFDNSTPARGNDQVQPHDRTHEAVPVHAGAPHDRTTLNGSGADSADGRSVHRDTVETPLFEATTRTVDALAVGEPTTVTVSLTAVTDATNVSVSLADYHFVEGDGRTFTLGSVREGETRTLDVTVTPTEELSQYLRFRARGVTAGGSHHQDVSHDLALVNRRTDRRALVVRDALRPLPEAIPDTTTDGTGDRRASAAIFRNQLDVSSATSSRVSGCFSYSDKNGALQPGRRLFVRVVDSDVDFNDVLATGRTNDNGCFDIRVADPESADFGANNVADVFVLIFADNPAAKTTTGAGRDRYKVRFPSGHRDLGNGEHLSLAPGGRLTTSSNDPAYQAVDWALDVRRFVDREASYTRSQVRIQWPQTDWPSYNPSGVVEHISLPDRSDRDWDNDTVYHEYGHALMDAMYGHSASKKPDGCPANQLKRLGCVDDHVRYSETNPGFAMIEGWAEFIQGATSHYDTGTTASNAENNNWFNLSISDKTDSDGDTTPGSDAGDMDGNRVEGNVAAILYDMYDPARGDGIQADLEDIFDTVKDNNVQSIEDFLSHWRHGHEEALASTAFRNGVPEPDPYEPNEKFSEAAPIGLGNITATTTSGIDMYKITVPRWTNTTVVLDGTFSVAPSVVDESQLTVWEQTDGSGRTWTNGSERDTKSVGLPATGDTTETYYVQVVTSGPGMIYDLKFVTDLADDNFEDNDRVTDAARIPGDGTERNLRMSEDSVDYFEVSAIDGGQINVSATRDVDGLPSGRDATDVFTLTLYNRRGKPIADTTGDTGVPTINYTIDGRGDGTGLGSGDYGISVRSSSSNLPLSYDLHVSARSPANDRFEPNDGMDDATLPHLTTVQGRIVADEKDWFARSVSAGSRLNVTVVKPRSESIDFEVFEPDGGYYTAKSANGSIVVPDTDAGPYRVLIESVDSDTTDYWLTMTEDETPEVDPNPDRFESNDDFGTATWIDRHLSDGSLSIVGGEDDYYQLGLNAGDQLSVNLSYNASHVSGSASLSLYGPGQVPLQNAGFGTKRSVTVPEDGTYYVTVSGNDEYPYHLSVEGNDEFEDNDERAEAATYPNRRVGGFNGGFELLTEFNASLVASEDDWYALSLQSGDRLSMDVNPTESTVGGLPAGYLAVSVYDDGGTLLGGSGPNGEVTVEAPRNSTYYVRVHPSFTDPTTTDYGLTLRHSPGSADEPNDDLENATLFVPGETERAVLADGLDEDYYAVYLEQREGLEVNAGFSGTSDLDVAIYGPGGSQITGTSTGPLNEVTVSADTIATRSGYYYVRVDGSTTGKKYNLSVATVEDDGFERNDDWLDPALVSFQTIDARLFRGTDSRPGERDYYAVEVPGPTTLRGALSFEHHGLSNSTVEDGSDLNLALLNASGTVLATNTSVGDHATLRVPLSSAGTYIFRVTGLGIDTVTPYRLTVDSNTPALGRDVDGIERYLDTPVTTAAGSLLTESRVEFGMASGQNVSHAVNLRTGERLAVSTLADGNVDLAVSNDGGDRLRSSTGPAGNESLAFVAPTNGTYYVETISAGDGPVTVTLGGSTSLAGNDRFEVNDRFGSAAQLYPATFDGLRLDGADAAGGPDEDFYAVSLREEQRLTVTSTGSDLDGSVELTIYGPNRSERATEMFSASTTASAGVTAEGQGTYYVRVRGEASGNYSLSLHVKTPTNDRFEANNGIEESEPLSPGTYEGLRIPTGDRDVFALELTDDEHLSADLRFDQGEGDLNLRLYGPSGDLLDASTSDTDDESATLMANGSGSYYVGVRGFQGGAANYTLELATRVPPEDDRYEPNGIDSPTPIEPGIYDDLAVVDGDDDVFAVQFPVDSHVSVGASFDHDDGNLDLAVYRPDGTTVESSVSVTDGESLSFATPSAGVYYVHVRGGGDISAAYDIEIAGPGTTPADEAVSLPSSEKDDERNESGDEQVDLVWNTSLGGPDQDSFNAIVPTGDGGYVVAGEFGAERFARGAPWLVNVDRTGAVVWNRTVAVDSSNEGELHAVVPTDDGGYLAVGERHGLSEGGLAVKVTAEGTREWLRTYGGGDDGTEFFDVAKTASGGYVFAGSSYLGPQNESSAERSSNGFVVRVRSDGTVLWERAFGGPSTADGLGSIHRTASGRFRFFGSYAFGLRQWFGALGSDGSVVENRTVPGPGLVSMPGDPVNTATGYAVVGASSERLFGGTTDAYFLRTDRAARIQTNRTYDLALPNGTVGGITQTTDGGFAVALEGVEGGSLTGGILKIGPDGARQGRGTFGPAGRSSMADVVAGSDGSVVFTGRLNASRDDGWIAKTEPGFDGGGDRETQSSAPTLPGFEEPASDADGDGQWEDVNGDGSASIGDVQALFVNRDDDAVQNNPDGFDFNDDGSFSIGDVQAFFVEVIG